MYSFKWLLLLVSALYLVLTVANRFYHGQYKDNLYFQMLFLFCMPLLSLMAFVGGFGCLVKGACLKLLNKDRRFDAALNEFTP